MTRSEKGMSLISRGAPAVHLPARKREVFRRLRCSDTEWRPSLWHCKRVCHRRRYAACQMSPLVWWVSKQGTATCTLDELEEELHADLYTPDVKVRPQAEAKSIALSGVVLA